MQCQYKMTKGCTEIRRVTVSRMWRRTCSCTLREPGRQGSDAIYRDFKKLYSGGFLRWPLKGTQISCSECEYLCESKEARCPTDVPYSFLSTLKCPRKILTFREWIWCSRGCSCWMFHLNLTALPLKNFRKGETIKHLPVYCFWLS